MHLLKNRMISLHIFIRIILVTYLLTMVNGPIVLEIFSNFGILLTQHFPS